MITAASPIAPGAGRRATQWTGLSFLLVLLPYELLAAFANPGADDLTYALDTRRDGYLVALRDQYFLWNGRYASNVLELGGPMVWGSVALYKVVAAAMIPATAIAFYVFIRTMVGVAWTRGQAVTAALCLTAIFLGGVPALGESIYWYTGSVTYQLSALMLIVQAALTAGALRSSGPGRAWRGVAGALLTVAITGMNEVAMLLIVAFQASLVLVGAVARSRRTIVVAAVTLAIAVGCGLVVWLAPGNAVRGAMFPARHQLLRSTLMTALQTVRFTADWWTDGSLLLASLIYLPLGVELVRAAPDVQALGRGHTPLWLLAGTIAVIPLAIFPPYWASGDLGQHRTISVAYCIFLPLWFAALTAALAAGWLPAPGRWLADRRIQVIVFVLLIVSLAFTRNGYRVAFDFASGRPAAFDREMSARLADLRACTATPARPCVIPTLRAKPESFSLPDISSDPADWVNAGYASYFGLARVVAGTRP
jgi:uncharacterized protein DUF6056